MIDRIELYFSELTWKYRSCCMVWNDKCYL